MNKHLNIIIQPCLAIGNKRRLMGTSVPAWLVDFSPRVGKSLALSRSLALAKSRWRENYSWNRLGSIDVNNIYTSSTPLPHGVPVAQW